MKQWIARTKKLFKINKTNINNSNRKITDYYANKERIIRKTLTDQMQKNQKQISSEITYTNYQITIDETITKETHLGRKYQILHRQFKI